MALPVLNITDFIGPLSVQQGGKNNQFEDYLSLNTDKVWRKLMSPSLVKLVRDGSHPAYQLLTEGGEYTDSEGDVMYVRGLKQAAMQLHLFYFDRDDFRSNTNGRYKMQAENSRQLSNHELQALCASRHNEAAFISQEACHFMRQFYERGVTCTVAFDGTNSTVSYTSSELIQDGDTIVIQSAEYTVTAAAEGSFVIENADLSSTEKFSYSLFTRKEYEYKLCFILR